MKKKISYTLLSLIIICLNGNSQTNVSGTISTNTTWTISGSPYIVSGIVDIDFGLQLTIQPGVVVKFADDAFIYTNEGSIVAIGTNTDSITFTSNSATPAPGIWQGIQLNGGPDSSSVFNYCTFKYAGIAIHDNQGTMDLLTIKNSSFVYNIIGLKDEGRMIHVDTCTFKQNDCSLSEIGNSIISNCIISNNQYGFLNEYFAESGNLICNCMIDSNQTGLKGILPYTTIENCKVRYNHYGMLLNYGYEIRVKGNQVDSNTSAGIIVSAGGISIDSNEISHNYIGIIDSGGMNQNNFTRNRMEFNNIGIKLAAENDNYHCNKICSSLSYDLKVITSDSVNISNNYWCTIDSATIQLRIFDGNDSTGLGMAHFMPPDTNQCYNCPNIIITYTAIPATYPLQNGSATAYPSNGTPPYTYWWSTSPPQTTQTAIALGVGFYTVCVTDSAYCSNCIGVYIADSNTVYVKEFSHSKTFLLFPNPTSEHLTVSLLITSLKTNVEILNSFGQLEYSLITTASKFNINTANLINGIHFIKIVTDGKIEIQKFIKITNNR
jgi:parallel beta-helix repeat protein